MAGLRTSRPLTPLWKPIMIVCERAVAAFFRSNGFIVHCETCKRTHVRSVDRSQHASVSFRLRLDRAKRGFALVVTDMQLEDELLAGERTVRRFCQMMRALLRTVPLLYAVKVKLWSARAGQGEPPVRSRFGPVLEREGAVWRSEDGHMWFVFCRQAD